MKKIILVFFICLGIISKSSSQTTDLSIIVEAQDLMGTDISQANIYDDFQYLITIVNSGNAVENATFSVQLDAGLTVNSFTSQNASGGASDATGFNLDATNLLTGTVANLPNNASVEILILVTAPTTLGGIAANAIVSAPDNTTDTNTSNNQSIISIDILDIPIDFTVTQTQITPPEGTSITAWGQDVTYQITITNNSSIDFPLEAFEGKMDLISPFNNGQPFVEFISIECINNTNGTLCPDLTTGVLGGITPINGTNRTIFMFNTPQEFTVNGSLTFEVVYRYLEPLCSLELLPIAVNAYAEISINHANESSNVSNTVTTDLIEGQLCDITDVCIETNQIDPIPGGVLAYNQEITFETVVCNNGPLDAPVSFFFQNIPSTGIFWEIISAECTGTTGSINCDDFEILIDDQFWTSNEFILPADTTITIETVAIFLEPECSIDPSVIPANLRSVIGIEDIEPIDIVPENNFDVDQPQFPGAPLCPTSDLSVTKTQISPMLPEGSSSTNTAEWGPVGYEITIQNNGDQDANIILDDFMPIVMESSISASLISVECVGTTGGASCFPINNANIGVVLDGVTDDGNPDMFWQILEADNWQMPANSSVTFEVFIDWFPQCSPGSISGTNQVMVQYASGVTDSNPTNNNDQVTTVFAPCVDLVVQTFPEATQVDINQTFDWIIDISNSTTSSDAVDVFFEDIVNDVFTITGTPTCEVTSGNATCISTFDIVDNTITGVIPTMEAGSTVRVRIPVVAPSFGGAFNNIAEAIPSEANNEELTPETNISISNVQVIAPTLEKQFDPDIIFEGAESTLTFTIFNIGGNPTQSNISFTDNLPTGIFLTESPIWVEDNGCTATFIGQNGDDFVGVTDLVFPDGVASCTFSVVVTSDIAGVYLNNNTNFSNNNNIDTSQTSATLTVIVDPTDVDIEIIKTVSPEEVALGDEVTFSITASNLGTTTGTSILISDILPTGYDYLSHTVTAGAFDDSILSWSIDELDPGASETLSLTVRVISSISLVNIAILDDLDQTDRDESNNQDNANVTINNCLQIPNGVSPNQDGVNDYLVIPCIEDYAENTLKIFNRLGVQVYQGENYKNTWDGKANMGFPDTSSLLPVGTYYYVLEIIDREDPIMGWVYLNY